MSEIKLVNKDNRGTIEEVAKNVDILRIRTMPGSKRADHKHKTSSHQVLVTKGSIWYYERPEGSNKAPSLRLYKEGEVFFTGPKIEHAMRFSEYTEFFCFSYGDRKQENYEDDLVRLEFDLEEIYNKSSFKFETNTVAL